MATTIKAMDTKSQLREKTKNAEDSNRLIINWNITIPLALIHIGAIYGIYLVFTSANPKTAIFAFFYGYLGILGITAGNHRLWSHRSYKARLPLRILLCIFSTIAHEKSIFVWVREHRIHHKYAETNADPYSIKRGFFFAHIGWLMVRHHPEFKAKISSVSMDDLLADPLIVFERKYQITLKTIISAIVPTMIAFWFWNESPWNAFFIAVSLRVFTFYHINFQINSVAHTYGYRLYDKKITARDNPLMAALTLGEGFHNFHHVFPWDYSTSELGYTHNLTKVFIDIMAKLGLAYDLKTVSSDMIQSKISKSEEIIPKGSHGTFNKVIRSDFLKENQTKAKSP